MSDVEMRGGPAMTAGDTGASPAVAAAETSIRTAPRLVPPTAPRLDAFQSGPETRLRDLLAFALAAEAGKPVAAGDIAALRQKAEAELHVNALRTLHNQVETLRLEAATEALSRAGRSLGFGTLLAANLLALGIAAGAGWLVWRAMHPLAGG